MVTGKNVSYLPEKNDGKEGKAEGKKDLSVYIIESKYKKYGEDIKHRGIRMTRRKQGIIHRLVSHSIRRKTWLKYYHKKNPPAKAGGLRMYVKKLLEDFDQMKVMLAATRSVTLVTPWNLAKLETSKSPDAKVVLETAPPEELLARAM